MFVNYYRVLGVSRNAPKEENIAVYRRLAKKYHPDVGGDTDQFFCSRKRMLLEQMTYNESNMIGSLDFIEAK